MAFLSNTLLTSFWSKYPALLFASVALLGAALGSSFHLSFFVPLSLILIPFYTQKKLLLILVSLFFLCFFHAKLYQEIPKHLPQKKEGLCHFSIDSLQRKTSPFHTKYFSYKGTIKYFLTKEGDAFHHIPCQISMPYEENYYKANQEYLILGHLEEKEEGKIVFKPAKKVPWQPIAQSFSFAEIRFLLKSYVSSYIEKSIPDSRASTFLAALFTGEIEDRSMSFFFTKVGLAHILAISGFHFALLAAFFHIGLRFFFSPKLSAWLLLSIVTGYFFFIGPLASVTRAWISISLFLLGKIFERKTSGLNVLGAAMLVEIIFSPHIVKQVGFQLSFLCTFAILLAYKPCENLLTFLLPRRSLSQALELSSFSQYGYLFTTFLRKGLALNLAVTIFSLPTLLLIFHTFPYMSLFYNLFIPVGVSVIFALLLLGMVVSFVPFLSEGVHACTSVLTKHILDIAYYSPTNFSYSLQTPSFPLTLVVCFLCSVFISAVFMQKTLQQPEGFRVNSL